MVQLREMLMPALGGLDLVPGSAQEIESLESKLLGLPSIKYLQRSYFAPGVWVRELHIPGPVREDPSTWALILGHEHIHENLNILGKGEKLIVIGERVERMVAPYCVLSGPGVRKVGLIMSEMIWYSIHHNPTNEQDEEKLEAMFYRKSGTFKAHEMREAELKLQGLIPATP